TDGLHGVRAREGVDLEPVLRDLRVEDLDRWCKSAHLHDVCVAAHVDGVVSVGGVHNDAVGLPVAGGPAEGACQVDIQAGDVCPGQVVDSYVVGTAEGVEINALDAGGVHGDVALGPDELEPLPVCRQLDLL